MPAPAVAKGILISIAIIAALGLAVMESPPIREWLEEQRRKLAELLRSIGEELDPQTRRQAEAFAFEGRTPTNDIGLQREASGSLDAAAVATGRSMSSGTTVRRIPVSGPVSPEEAEERRRKGREYLAKRNEQMIELQSRTKSGNVADTTPPSPTSFDAMVDENGHLKTPMFETEALPAEPSSIANTSSELQPSKSDADTSIQRSWAAWQFGSEVANPFGDEYALERSITPKPPVPPKVELDRAPTPEIPVPTSLPTIERVPSPEIVVPGSFDAASAQTSTHRQEDSSDELSFEEQMAIAMSLSEQDSANSATVMQRQTAEDDQDLQAAIAASLRELDDQQAAHAIAHASHHSLAKPLIDLTASSQIAISSRASEWQSLFDHHIPQPDGTRAARGDCLSETSDELYRLTPQLTRARLAVHNAQQASQPTVPGSQSAAEARPVQPVQDVMDASFYSAPSEVVPPSDNSRTLERETPQLIDVDDAPQDGMRTPTTRPISSPSLVAQSEAESFASVAAPANRTQSRAQSEMSTAELLEVVEDSDVDMLSEEGDGILTPDSWSEIESRDADSDGEHEGQMAAA